MPLPESAKGPDPIERDFMDALERLVQGKPTHKALKDLLKKKGKLPVNGVNVALEAEHSRTLISMDSCRYPKVREAIRLAKVGKTNEPQNYRQLVQNLRAALAEEKATNKLLHLQVQVHFTARKTAEEKARNAERVAAQLKKEVAKLSRVVHLTAPDRPLRARLVLIRGLPGTGKTRLANGYKEQGYQHFEADMFFESNDIYSFDEERLPEAHAWCLRQVHAALEAGGFVVVANVFARVEDIEPYTRLGFDYKVIEAKNRGKSIHQVPPEVMQAMKARWVPMDTLVDQLKRNTRGKSGCVVPPFSGTCRE